MKKNRQNHPVCSIKYSYKNVKIIFIFYNKDPVIYMLTVCRYSSYFAGDVALCHEFQAYLFAVKLS